MVDSEAPITEDTTGAAELQSGGSTERYPSPAGDHQSDLVLEFLIGSLPGRPL